MFSVELTAQAGLERGPDRGRQPGLHEVRHDHQAWQGRRVTAAMLCLVSSDHPPS
jgi:hypothetical protein